MNTSRILSLSAALALAAMSARAADTLATWSLNNTAEGTTDHVDALAPGNVTAGPAVSGITLNDNGLSGKGWTSPSLNSNAYFQFTVSVASNYWLSLADLTMNLRSTSTGPGTVEIRHSLNNGASWSSDGVLTLQKDSNPYNKTLDCSRVTVQGGQTLTVRIYAWGASDAGGTFRVGNGSKGGGPIILTGTAGTTTQPPTILFPHAAEWVAVSNKLKVDISVLPAGSGLTKTWSFLPKPDSKSKYALSGKRFTFTPAMEDEGKTFILSVSATNSNGSSTAELPVTVTEYIQPESWFTGFENGNDPNYPMSAVEVEIDELTWTIQQLAFDSSETTPKFGERACVFGNNNEAYMVSADKMLAPSNGFGGFGTVSFLYAEYPGEENPCQPIFVEVATDLARGDWVVLGNVNPDGVDTLEREEFVLNITEPVYLRIRTGYVNKSGRVVLDQLAVKPCVLPERTEFETYLLKYNVTPGDPGCASEKIWAAEETSTSYLTDDFDEDGYSNWAEFKATPQTNPYDKTSHP